MPNVQQPVPGKSIAPESPYREPEYIKQQYSNLSTATVRTPLDPTEETPMSKSAEEIPDQVQKSQQSSDSSVPESDTQKKESVAQVASDADADDNHEVTIRLR